MVLLQTWKETYLVCPFIGQRREKLIQDVSVSPVEL